MHDKKEATQQIIGASTNLLGVCIVIITALKVTGSGNLTIVDESTALASMLFLVSCIFAYLSMRRDGPRTGIFRDIADYSFLVGVSVFAIGTLLLAFDIIR